MDTEKEQAVEVEEQDVVNYEEELARRLAAAYISMQLGISLQYAYKKYTQKGDIGSYWLALARRVVTFS